MSDDLTTTGAAPDFLRLAREAYTASTTYFDASIRPQIEAGIKQFQGVHPSGSKYHSDTYKSRSRLFRPKTRTAIRKNEAVAAEAFFSTADVVTVTGEDQDNQVQRAAAEVMQALLNYRLKKSIPWFQILIGAYQDAQAVGVCIGHPYWKYDPRKGIDKPCIDLIPTENLRIDPGADWTDPINSSPYVIRLIPMYVKDVKARMRMVDHTTSRPKWKHIDDAALLAGVQSYSDSTRQTREKGRTDSTEQRSAISDFAMVWVHQNIIEIDGGDMVFYTLGTTALLSDPVPLEQVWFHGIRPYVMGTCVLETHKLYSDGLTGISKDVQVEINEVANQRIDNVKFAMNKRWLAKRGAQVDLRSITRNVPGSVTMVQDIEKDVKVMETPDVTASAYQEQDRLNLDFDDVTGSFSQGSVQSNRKLNETVGGMNLLSTTANQVGAYQLRTFVETFVEPVLNQLIALERKYETDEVVLTLAGNAAKLSRFLSADRIASETLMDELLEQELTLNVNVGIGSTNPQEQINAFISAMANLRQILADNILTNHGLDVAEVIRELFGKLGYKSGGARFFSVEQEAPELTAAKATIAELQQALAQKVSPEMVAAQIRKIDAEVETLGAKTKDALASAFEATLRGMFSGGQIAQMLAAVPQMAPVADQVIQAAGYQPPSPGGVDPNLPQLAAPAAGLVQNSVRDPRSGVEFMPGAPGDTTPNTPAAPMSPADGAGQGIETMEADS